MSEKKNSDAYAYAYAYAGGIAGVVASTEALTHCYTTVNVKAGGNLGTNHAGGIAGLSYMNISCTYAVGTVEATDGIINYAGGICGLAEAYMYSTSSISNNLALNVSIQGDEGTSKRITQKKDRVTLTSNYASPQISVNGSVVNGGTGDGEDGDPSITFNTFKDKLKWDGWTFPDGYLPQLQLRGEDSDNSPTYTAWPAYSPQPLIAPLDFLPGSIANTGGGDGSTSQKAIRIANRAELAYFAQQVNTRGDLTLGTGGPIKNEKGFEGKYFALSGNIDLSELPWTPIGKDSNPFNGHFDGKGHCVSGLTVEMTETDKVAYAGLFGNAPFATIRNLGVKLASAGIRVSATDVMVHAGGIAGQAKNIHNCYVEGPGTVEAKAKEINFSPASYTGGIVGYLFNGFLTHCYATVDVKAEGDGDTRAGGIAGYLQGSLSCTYATGAVETTGEGENYSGGICGYVVSSSNSTLSHNLALNKEIKGRAGKSHRIAGHTDVTPASNYASPEILVNGATTGSGGADNAEGDGEIDLDNYAGKLKENNSDWGKTDIWSFGADGSLPQLKGLKLQPTLPASDYLIAAKIANTSSGTGDSWDSPILIADRGELVYFAQQVNSRNPIKYGNNNSIDHNGKEEQRGGFRNYYFALSADIDLDERPWTPIGKDYDHSFNGNFDGRGHCVSGLTVEVTETSKVAYAGLFGCTSHGTLRNLGVKLAKAGIRANATNRSAQSGGIAGLATHIHNCYVEGPGTVEAKVTKTDGTTTPNSYAGGIVGKLTDGSLTHCYATVDMKAEGGDLSYAGGIAGHLQGPLSYIYATGAVEAKGGGKGNYSGGICGYVFGINSGLSYSLALNKKIEGGEDKSHRIAGNADAKSASNYAFPNMLLNGEPLSPAGLSPDSPDGANTWLDTYQSDLLPDPADDNNGWVKAWTFPAGNLPQLKKVEGDGDNLSYVEWKNTSGNNNQPSLTAADYLLPGKILYFTQPANGTLSVSDPWGNSLTNGDKIASGTVLTLSASSASGYEWEAYLVSYDGTSFTDHTTATIPMPATSDLYLSARFKRKPDPDPDPEPTVYYTVTLPQVEGCETDPVAGSYLVESWSDFRFYLTIDTAYSASQPVVTTSRNETLTSRPGDGAYVVGAVSSDVLVFIDGLVKNPPPVGNESVDASGGLPKIWVEGSYLCIRTSERAGGVPVRILTPGGNLLYSFRSVPGLSRQHLPTGMYIVQVGDTVGKVLLK